MEKKAGRNMKEKWIQEGNKRKGIRNKAKMPWCPKDRPEWKCKKGHWRNRRKQPKEKKMRLKKSK